MVLMRERRAEHREDAIAGGLHDVTIVAADRVDHQFERGIDNRARFFGIEVLLQLSRAFDIREQRSDSSCAHPRDFRQWASQLLESVHHWISLPRQPAR